MGVSNLVAPSGGGDTNWTLVSTLAATSSTTLSWTSLSGYKVYKLIISNITASTNRSFTLTINGVTTGYHYGGQYYDTTSASAIYNFGTSSINLFGGGVTSGVSVSVFNQSDLTGLKDIVISSVGRSSASTNTSQTVIASNNEASTLSALTSITITLSGAATGGSLSLYGGN